jgi:lipid A 3-O-deacylase
VDRLRIAVIGVAGAFLAAAGAGPAQADPRERFTALEENDSLYFNSDKHYTQGLRFSYLAPELRPESGWNGTFDFLESLPALLLPSPEGKERSRRFAVFLGQSLFTPKDLTRDPPDPHDRPYAGWLYGGVSLLQETDGRILDNFELQLGVIGPQALGQSTQNDFHQIIGKETASWNGQLQTEPGLVLAYERKWRVPLIGDGANGLDVIPEGGATLGNVFTYASAGGLLRVGKNLGMDYGPIRIRPALSGTDYVDADHADGDFGFYLYAGAQGRAVARNVFLDGNSFRSSAGVDHKTWVADLQAGTALYWTTSIRLDFSVVRRTPEFEGQGKPDVIGTAALSFSW